MCFLLYFPFDFDEPQKINWIFYLDQGQIKTEETILKNAVGFYIFQRMCIKKQKL